jgi:hypothetical protein
MQTYLNNGGINMKFDLSNIFKRGNLSSNNEIINWWNKGRWMLNIVLLLYTIIYLAVIVLIFKNGWIVFLLPIILLLFVIINVFFSIGLFIELIALRIFRAKINFDLVAPEIKKWEFILIALFVLTFSILDLSNQ